VSPMPLRRGLMEEPENQMMTWTDAGCLIL